MDAANSAAQQYQRRKSPSAPGHRNVPGEGSCGFMSFKGLKLHHLPPEPSRHDAKPSGFGGNSILLVLKAELGSGHIHYG